ncbi:PAS domain-containing protein [Asticcacaulis sp. ZE23SCel15]|uniref:motility/cell cycle regulatory protein MopJ n=1 Tax=Asticcacaulis sp. ZE23SCel15 TaxID=3059027 RepID=UPI00349EC8E3
MARFVMAGIAAEMASALRGHEDIFRYWKGLRKPGRLPARADIDPCALRKLLPTISLIDVSDSYPANGQHVLPPEAFRQRLAGTELFSAYGTEITGKTFDEIYTAEEAQYWAEELSLVATTRKPNVGLHSMAWRGARGLSLFWLRLPLASDGVKVDMILGHDAMIGRLEAPTSGIRAA